MLTLTHLSISAVATAGILGTTDPIAISIGAIAGILPDIDVTKSPAGRIFFPISKYLEKHFTHRSFTHSILASAIVAIVAYTFCYFGLLQWLYGHSIAIGFTFGYLADLITKSGVQLFYPSRVRCVIPGNRNYRIATGSNPEYALLICSIALLFLILNINSRGGASFTVNQFLATPRGVQELLADKGRSNQIIATIEGSNNSDRSQVNNKFLVLEQTGVNSFLVAPIDKLNQIYEVSNKPDSGQIFAKKIVASLGDKIDFQYRRVLFQDEEIQPRLRSIDNERAQVFLKGWLTIEDAEELTIEPESDRYQSITKKGSKLELNFCPLDKLMKLSSGLWGKGSLRAIYMLKPS
jgi:inner membrane protein